MPLTDKIIKRLTDCIEINQLCKPSFSHDRYFLSSKRRKICKSKYNGLDKITCTYHITIQNYSQKQEPFSPH